MQKTFRIKVSQLRKLTRRKLIGNSSVTQAFTDSHLRNDKIK